MPLYEYKCNQCHKTFEFLEKIHDKPKTICPDCQKATLHRQVSLAGFKLKGSGWYATDFKDKKQPEKTNTTTENKTQPKESKDNKQKTNETKE